MSYRASSGRDGMGSAERKKQEMEPRGAVLRELPRKEWTKGRFGSWWQQKILLWLCNRY